jgi:cell division protein ZapA
MAQVSVTIAGRTYRMACGDGEEAHLVGLAHAVDEKISSLKTAFGEIGDQRLTVMTALTFADELVEAKKKLVLLAEENERLRGLAETVHADQETLAAAVTDCLNSAASRIESIARDLAPDVGPKS